MIEWRVVCYGGGRSCVTVGEENVKTEDVREDEEMKVV